MEEKECTLTKDGLDAVIDLHKHQRNPGPGTGRRHLAANALYQIEVDHVRRSHLMLIW